MDGIGIVAGVIGGLIGGLLGPFLVWRVWPRHDKWGINVNPVNCPRCNQLMPVIRIPANRRQLLWGGWTCPNCGCEMDKYGKSVESSSP